MSTIPNSDHFPTAVFLGDSVTTGWRALSHPRNRWTSLVCEHQRWREVNLAADGLGFFARRGGHLPGGQPDVVTISLGLNDAAFLPSQRELVEQAIDHDLTFFSTRLRGTPVIVAPYFPSLEIGPRFQAIHRLVHEGATSLGLSSTDALTTAINGDEDRLAIDQIHPDDAGHAQMARAMISLYAELLPSA